jgi:hypothetical protein
MARPCHAVPAADCRCREEDVNLPIRIWVDADALPTEIKEIVLRPLAG